MTTRPIRVAAVTVLLRRDGSSWDIFWARRAPNLAFLGGFWGFPGGGAEPSDVDLFATAA